MNLYAFTSTAVWLRRVCHCRGFGIQSPSDYWIVRYVINEHWPYYAYETLGENDSRLTRKIGRLCFRLSNWLQPSVIESTCYQPYFQAGCRRVTFGPSTELIVLTLDGDCRSRLAAIYKKVTHRTVLLVTDLYRNYDIWREIVSDDNSRITFDLYYCGIVMFDRKRHKKNYIINF